MSKFFTRDRIAGLIILAVSGSWCYLAMQLPRSHVKGIPGPAFFPVTVLAASVFLSLILLVRKSPAGENGGEKILIPRELATIALMLGYVIAVPFLGFAVGTFAGLAVLLFHSRKVSPPGIVLTAAAASLALHLLFKVLLGIPLPSGVFF